MASQSRPDPSEHSAYIARYVNLVPDGPIGETLARQFEEDLPIYRGISEEKGAYRYAPGKWTVKQVLGHMIDTERIIGYRGLLAGRGDKNPIPGFEQDDYVAAANFDDRSVSDLIDEFAAVRAATVRMFTHMTDEMLLRRAVANNNEISARAAAFMIAGHERYHVAHMKEHYL
jgi:uncharacterized damage-inducible protein DinB